MKMKIMLLGLLAALLGGVAIVRAQTTTYWTLDGAWSAPHFNAVSAPIGGSLLLAGGCQSTNVTIPGILPTMTAVVSPQADPGNSVQWQAFIPSANTATVRICALLAATPPSIVYSIKILQ